MPSLLDSESNQSYSPTASILRHFSSCIAPDNSNPRSPHDAAGKRVGYGKTFQWVPLARTRKSTLKGLHPSRSHSAHQTSEPGLSTYSANAMDPKSLPSTTPVSSSTTFRTLPLVPASTYSILAFISRASEAHVFPFADIPQFKYISYFLDQ